VSQPRMVTTIAEVRDELRGRGRVALVPTMGALHEGHLAHVARARELADTVVVSIFVNPLQFGPTEDFRRYPRDIEADAAKLAGADILFAPSSDEMYPHGQAQTRVTAGDVGGVLEGRSRPGHYDGVLTVVTKLLNIVRPDIVTFGEKDAQQAFLVERMIRDLDMPVSLELIPVVREHDGLAMSSRNRYLAGDERRAALALSRALDAARSTAAPGAGAALAAARSVLDAEPLVVPDYVALVDPVGFSPVAEDHHGPARFLVAARVGTTRLLDTALLHLS
jgi:pantoate--beta-alanine ligase